MWRRQHRSHSVVVMTEIDTLFAALFDILQELRAIRRLLEDGDEQEESSDLDT